MTTTQKRRTILTPPTELTILVDWREKQPIGFPTTIEWSDPSRGVHSILALTVDRTQTLPTGDFTIAGHSDICIVERKGSLKELHQNLLTKDKTRQARALNRLSRVVHPILWLEAAPSEAWTPSEYCPNPQLVVSMLTGILARRGISLWWMPCPPTSRTRIGGLLALLMWGLVWEELNRRETDSMKGLSRGH